MMEEIGGVVRRLGVVTIVILLVYLIGGCFQNEFDGEAKKDKNSYSIEVVMDSGTYRFDGIEHITSNGGKVEFYDPKADCDITILSGIVKIRYGGFDD